MALTSELGFDAGDSVHCGTVLLAQDELVECLLEKGLSVFNHTWMTLCAQVILTMLVIMIPNVLFPIPAGSSSLQSSQPCWMSSKLCV